MDNHMLICQVKTDRDLVPFVSGTVETGEKNKIILHLKKDCLSAIPDSDFQELKKFLLNPNIISALVVDCEFSMSLYEKMYVFDLCFISEEGALRYEPEHRNGLRFLQLLCSPKASLGKEARVMNYEELIRHGCANALIRNQNFYEDLEFQMLNLTLGRTEVQLQGIKSCMNAYKDCCLLGEALTTDPETGYFCQLALIKTEEDGSNEI